MLVAEHTEEVVAMVTAQLVVSTAEGGPAALVEDMVVEAAERGRGLGRRLLEAAEAWAAARGATPAAPRRSRERAGAPLLRADGLAPDAARLPAARRKLATRRCRVPHALSGFVRGRCSLSHARGARDARHAPGLREVAGPGRAGPPSSGAVP